MLVLSRKEGEKIHIGDTVVVTLVRAGTGSVRLGIDAPADAKVLRGELTPFAESAAPTTPIAVPMTEEQVTAGPR
jgi:carbon storage regulator